MASIIKQTYIHSKNFDYSLIILPPFIITSWVLFSYAPTIHKTNLSPIILFLLLIVIDFSHISSTLFITYFNKKTLRDRKLLLINTPLIIFFCGYLVHLLFDENIFWLILTYITIFHVIRQQYGFLAIYSRNNDKIIVSKSYEIFRLIDKIFIHLLLVYPYINWHSNIINPSRLIYRRAFIPAYPYIDLLDIIFLSFTIISGILFFVKEIYIWRKFKFINYAKNSIIIISAYAWYVSLLYFRNLNSAYLMIIIATHAIPYFATVWIYGKKQNVLFIGYNFSFFKLRHLPLLIVICSLIGLFLLELWSQSIYGLTYINISFLKQFPQIQNKNIIYIVEPLFAIIQTSHFILDGFIWKLRTPNSHIKLLLKTNPLKKVIV